MIKSKLYSRYIEFTPDLEERINSPEKVYNDYNTLMDSIERAYKSKIFLA